KKIPQARVILAQPKVALAVRKNKIVLEDCLTASRGFLEERTKKIPQARVILAQPKVALAVRKNKGFGNCVPSAERSRTFFCFAKGFSPKTSTQKQKDT
ncbi:MAG: hypothetical protein IKM44_04890, partial [Clostridia bacterium]|nr:hypothetical protein [Clostridia bacterium]